MLSLLFRLPLDLGFKPHLGWLLRQECCWPSSRCFLEWTPGCVPLVETLKRPEPLLPFALFQRGVHPGKPLVCFWVLFFWLGDCHSALPACRTEVYQIFSNILLWCLAQPKLGGMHQEVNSAEGINAMPTHFCCQCQAGESTELESQGRRGDQRDGTRWSQPENHIQCHTAHISLSFQPSPPCPSSRGKCQRCSQELLSPLVGRSGLALVDPIPLAASSGCS